MRGNHHYILKYFIKYKGTGLMSDGQISVSYNQNKYKSVKPKVFSMFADNINHRSKKTSTH